MTINYGTPKLKATMKNFLIETGTDEKTGEKTQRVIQARTASSALSIHLKRGVSGLGRGWVLTRQPNGWIVASNKSGKTLERKYVRLREQDYSRYMDQRVD